MAMTDILFIPVILAVIGITVFSSYYILSSLNSSAIRTDITSPILDSGLSAVGSFDWIFPLITIMLGFGSIALAYFFPSHPILLVFGFLMFVLTFFLVPTIANIFSDFEDIPAMSDTKANFTIMDWTMENIPLIMSIFGFLMIIVLYSRNKNQSGGE